MRRARIPLEELLATGQGRGHEEEARVQCIWGYPAEWGYRWRDS